MRNQLLQTPLTYFSKMVRLTKSNSYLWLAMTLLAATTTAHAQDPAMVGEATMVIGRLKKKIELTLTNRLSMKYRMLIGRSALRHFYIDPTQSFLLGKNLKQREYLKKVKHS